MSLGTLTIDLAANVAQLSSDLGKANRLAEKSASQMEKRFNQLKTGIGTLFAGLSVGAFASWIKQSIDAADQVNDLSQKLGVSTQSLQAWGYAAQLSGGNMDTVGAALKKLNVNMSEAADGSDTAKAKFSAVGVSITDASGKLKSADQVMLELSDRFSTTADDANKTAAAIDLFGKSGADMIPVLNSGSEALSELMQQARDLGLVMSEENIQAAADFNDSLDTLSGVSRGYANHIAGELLPSLNTLTGYLISSANEAVNTGQAMSGLDAILRSLIATGATVGYVFQTVGRTLGAVAAAAVQAAKGEFSKASDIVGMAQADSNKEASKYLSDMEKIWNGTYQRMGEKAAKTNADVKKSIGDASKKEQERTVLLQKYGAELSGVSSKEYARKQAIDELKKALDAGTLTKEEYAKAEKAIGERYAETASKSKSATAAVKQHTDQVTSEIAQLEFKVATLGKTETQTELYKLSTDGATQAQLAHAEALLKQVDAYDANKKAEEEAKDQQEQLNDLMRQYDELITGAKSGTTEYGETLSDLNKLLQAGKINQDEYNAAVKRATENFDKSGESAIDWKEVMTDAAKSAKDALADFLYDPLGSGFDDMVTNFTEAIRKMAAQAAAAQIMESLFNKDTMSSITSWFSSLFSSAGSSSGGGITSMIGSLGSLFSFDGGGYTGSGSRVGGIDGKGGFLSIVHPNEGIFDYTKPNSSSNAVFAGGGSTTINQVINTTGRIDRRTSNQIANDTNRKQRIAKARLGA